MRFQNNKHTVTELILDLGYKVWLAMEHSLTQLHFPLSHLLLQVFSPSSKGRKPQRYSCSLNCKALPRWNRKHLWEFSHSTSSECRPGSRRGARVGDTKSNKKCHITSGSLQYSDAMRSIKVIRKPTYLYFSISNILLCNSYFLC